MMRVDLKALLKDRDMRLIDVAALLGVHKANPTRWAQHGLPPQRAIDIERVTGIPRSELRPDLWPREAAE